MKSLLSLLPLWALFLPACETSMEPADPRAQAAHSSTSDLNVTFFLADSSGNEQTTFRFRQDISFHYAIANESGQRLPYTVPDTGPIVRFEILSDSDSLVLGTSDDGVAYALVIVADTLEAGAALVHQYLWFSVPVHQPLPPGDYLARAVPRLHFEQLDRPAPLTIPFSITCDSTTQRCDSTSFVIITDQPPDVIQLHPFTLNQVRIQGDILTLNLSFSGGCVAHDFELFMSPAVFQESNPVQASLFVRHNNHDDACDAYLTKEVRFDLRPIAALYRHFYGSGGTVVLNVHEHPEHPPARTIQARYCFD